MSLSLGQRRALQQCSLPNGTFAMLAMDQRDSLRRSMSEEGLDHVPYIDVIALKKEVVQTLSPHASAVLLDAEYGYPACIASDALDGKPGLLLALETSGYDGDPLVRKTAIHPSWSVEKIRLAGASGVKLLVYYRPDAANAVEQKKIISDVAAACQTMQLPLFLEPLHYSLDPAVKVVSNDERRRLVIQTAKDLIPLGATVLKAAFPVDVGQTMDEGEWLDACQELSDVCSVPWVLLSAGVDFATFEKQVQVACAGGASGILCGRAVWKESVPLQGAERTAFLQETAIDRFHRLVDIVEDSARPFTDFYNPSSGIDLENWYHE